MSRFSKCPRLTSDSSIPAQSEMQFSAPGEEEENSSCSFTFSYLSSSSSSASSPAMLGNQEEEEEKVAEKEIEKKEGEEEEQGEEEEMQEQPAAETPGPSLSPQRYVAQSTSVGGSGGPESEETSSLQASADPGSSYRDPVEQMVYNLVRYMVAKYRLRKPITRAEMMKVVKSDRGQFPEVFQKACKCLEVICGIDVKEVVPATHSYVLVNSLDLTYDEMLGDLQSMPKNGLLIIILGLIFLDGNCASEENIWEFLSMLEVHPGREHFIYGEPRKLITQTWVRENYLLYQQVPDSDPPRYTFMWGPRAHAETSKLQVLEFLAKIKGTDPISFSCWYEEALRDDREKAQARVAPVGRAAALSMAQK